MKLKEEKREKNEIGQKENYLYIKFPARPKNERLARMIAAAFLADMNPNLEELDDVKTAVSEAVTNSIIHAYEKKNLHEKEETRNSNDEEKESEKNRKENEVEMELIQEGQTLLITITDKGKGIEDIKQAMEPLFTTKPDEERSGMGFSFMEAFMNELSVESESEKGTIVKMKKIIGRTDS